MKNLLVTIDVEVDKDFEWKVSSNFSFKSIKEMTQGKFLDLCLRYKIKPVLFLSPEILRHNESVQLILKFKEETSCELASHLHTEFQRIDWGEESYYSGKLINEVQAELEYDAEFKLMNDYLSDFEKVFNYKPVSFRPGRYGMSKNTYDILTKLGYKYSSTITPGLLWNFKDDIKVDFTKESNSHKIINTKFGRILEIPICILKRKFNFFSKINLIDRITQYLFPYIFSPIWLRPSFNRLNKSLIEKIFNHNLTYFVLLFHSNELVLGASPYSVSTPRLNMIFENLEAIFKYSNEKKIESITFEDINLNKI